MIKIYHPLIFVLISLAYPLAAQTTLTPQTIDNNFNSPAGIFAGDIDMDGDLDVVAGSSINGIKLWINEGGNPVQWTKQQIDNNTGICLSVSIADIVRDGLPDIVGISTDRNQLFYYKNEGGDPVTWTKQIISSITDPHEIYVCDFDNDGNQDVFVAGMSDTGEITWWHNDGGDPVEWTKQVISNHEPGARSVHVGDIDGDGDNDVAGAIFATDEVTWWRNDGGNPISWTKMVVANDFDGSHRIQVEDMDNDGDMDLIATAYMAAEIAIWTNDDGLGTSWSKHSVVNDLGGAVIGVAADINSDGFMDVFGTAQGTHTAAWYKNKGNGALEFREYILDDSFLGVWPAFVGDIDNDRDMDLLAGGNNNNEIRWWVNSQAGRFNNRASIEGLPTNIGFFVPEDYDPSQSYKTLLALHTCGDENEYSRYRDNLIQFCLEQDYILVSPDCRNTITDLGIPGPGLILDVMDYATARFNIDEEYVYMTGGSCNGQTCLKYGLDKIYPFRGIIPFNPWLPNLTAGFYDFTSDMPVCFALGSLDPNYNMAQQAFNNLMAEKGRAGFVTIPGVGHDFYIPEVTETIIECIRIIDSINENSTGLNDTERMKGNIRIYPNPFGEKINIEFPDNYQGESEISLLDVTGRELYRKRFSGSDISLDMGGVNVKEGMLYLRIRNDDKTIIKKLLRTMIN